MKKFCDMLKEYSIERVLSRMICDEDETKWDDLLAEYYGLYCNMLARIKDYHSSRMFVLAGFRRSEEDETFCIRVFELDKDIERSEIEKHFYKNWKDVSLTDLYIPETSRGAYNGSYGDLDVICSMLYIVRGKCKIRRQENPSLFQYVKKICRNNNLFPKELFVLEYVKHFLEYGGVFFEQEILNECYEITRRNAGLTWNELLKNDDFSIELCEKVNPFNPPEPSKCKDIHRSMVMSNCLAFHERDFKNEIVIADSECSDLPRVFVRSGSSETCIAEYKTRDLVRMGIHVETEHTLEMEYVQVLIYLYYLYPIRMARQTKESSEIVISKDKE